jgi:hypothetical protein
MNNKRKMKKKKDRVLRIISLGLALNHDLPDLCLLSTGVSYQCPSLWILKTFYSIVFKCSRPKSHTVPSWPVICRTPCSTKLFHSTILKIPTATDHVVGYTTHLSKYQS